MKIWQRYIFKQLIQSFSFILTSILMIYIIIDFSIRGIKILSFNSTSPLSIILNYLNYFSVYFDLFISISFLLSSLKVLIDCNKNQELTALQMAGLSKKRLLSPFFFLAMILFSASLINNQWLSPDAGDQAHSFRNTHSDHKVKKGKVFSLLLKDESELVYHNFCAETQELSDVYWLRSTQDIWHMKTLRIDSNPPLAFFTDHLVRNESGLFEKRESFAERFFSELPWDLEATPQKFIPFENRPLVTLFKQAASPSSEKQNILAHLNYKLAWTFIPFFLLLAIAPKAFFFSRKNSSFLFIAYSLFGLITLTTLLNGMLILAENQVLPPALAIWSPLALSFVFVIRPFFKLS